MRVAIAGAGNVGVSIANDLQASGHDVLIIEQDVDLVSRLREHVSARFVAGDACEVSVLQEAGLEQVDVMVAATGDDEDNLVVSLLSKQEFAVPRVVARVNHPKNHWLFNETWGVDVSVSTPHLLTALVEEAVSVGQLVRILQFAEGQARLVEVTLAEDSPARDTAIADLALPRDATIVAVIRDRRVIVPRGDTTLKAGDEVVALVTDLAEEPVRSLLVGAKRPTGPSPTASQQADALQPGPQGPGLSI
jgi:trk system potassium uptake protein TrkA